MTVKELYKLFDEVNLSELLVPIEGWRCEYVGDKKELYEQALLEGKARKRGAYLKDKSGIRHGEGYYSESAEDRELLLRLAISSMADKHPLYVARVEKINYPKSEE